MAGVTTAGFDPKTSEEIFQSISDKIKSRVYDKANLGSDSSLGHIVQIFANHAAQNWEGISELSTTRDPTAAAGRFLDYICWITGTTRRGQSNSSVTLTLEVEAGQTINAGELFATAADGAPQWATLASVQNSGGATASFDVIAEAVDPGPIEANAGTITVAVNSPTGLVSVTNNEDAEPGQNLESDASLRVRRIAELSRLGAGPINSIRAALLDLDGMQSVSVQDNPTPVDVDGVPAYGFEAVIFDGTSAIVDDDDIAQAILDAGKALGAVTGGNTSGTATDDEGTAYTVKFSRAERLTIYLEIDLVVGANWPSNGAQLVKEAVADFGDSNLGVGDDVILRRLDEAIFGVQGAVDISEIRVGESGSPTQTTNYSVLARQIADLDTGRIQVNTTVG